MEFKKFANKTDYVEYLQIFVYHKLVIEEKKKFNIDEYLSFELKDTTINSYDDWVSNSHYNDSTVAKWFLENKESVNLFQQNFNKKYQPKVSIWSDRNKTEYFKEKLQDAFIFENYIAELISKRYGLNLGQYLTLEGQYDLGENALGIEIKNDTLIKKYGNVYIEYQEKSKASNWNYVNSGILKTDNCKYWLIGTPEQFYIFRKAILIDMFNEEIENLKKGIASKREIKFKQIATSKGYVYPIRNAIKDTISMDTMMNDIKLNLN
ncbi:hypothetical protein EZS27_019885 [termite gut metagenome]|uniref:Uncharacterized protein n=1 Tax=termite gut metagenome TaxID=433724 RepID=A0A5J4RCW9_9ZZZZ